MNNDTSRNILNRYRSLLFEIENNPLLKLSHDEVAELDLESQVEFYELRQKYRDLQTEYVHLSIILNKEGK